MASPGKRSGFTLIELLVVMAIFGFVIVGASRMMATVLKDFKQQSEITMSNIEGMVGLEMMRRDIENSGYGLFWDWQGANPIAYVEVDAGVSPVAAALNDNNGATPNPPRAVVIGDNTAWHNTDRLAIKSVNVTLSDRSDKWTFFKADNTVNAWVTAPTGSTFNENLVDNDRVIVISPEKVGDVESRVLIPATSPNGFSTKFLDRANFATRRQSYSFMYAVDPDTDLKMPFNRADFYVEGNAALPVNCARGTGILYKAVVAQGASLGFSAPMPLLDCVADLQVAVISDDDGDGNATDNHQGSDGVMSAWNAQQTRNIRQVLVFILAQDGIRDRAYTYSAATFRVGASDTGGALIFGRDFDFAANGVTDWQNYRWKLYTLVIKPVNLR